MSALHWEARRKQVVINRRAELKKSENENDDTYKAENIKRVAEEMSRDPATPINCLLHRSQAKLVQQPQVCSDMNNANMTKACLKSGEYSAKIKNRYTSINYLQQY